MECMSKVTEEQDSSERLRIPILQPSMSNLIYQSVLIRLNSMKSHFSNFCPLLPGRISKKSNILIVTNLLNPKLFRPKCPKACAPLWAPHRNKIHFVDFTLVTWYFNNSWLLIDGKCNNSGAINRLKRRDFYRIFLMQLISKIT